MDGTRFDHLTRVLVSGGSRRRFLGGLAALATGAVTHSAQAVSCPPGQIYRQRVGCICTLTARPPENGICPCPRGQSDTGDGRGCLQCRTADECPPGDACTTVTCVDGACVQAEVVCTATDACQIASCDPTVGCVTTDIVCPGEKVCQDGVCACPPGFAACDDLCYAVVDPPDSMAGQQLTWLLSILNGAPFTVDDVDAHFADFVDENQFYNFLLQRVANGSAVLVSATDEAIDGIPGRKTVAYAIRRSGEYGAVPRATRIELRTGPAGIITFLTMNGTGSECPPRP